MIKLDLRKELKYLYAPSAKKVEIVDVPRFQFVMIDGLIEPGLGPGSSPGFQEAMSALYGAAYTLKFMSKLRKEDPIDFTVMALEGLWWVEGGEFSFERKDNWGYTVMILQPDHITSEMFAEALGQLRKKKRRPARLLPPAPGGVPGRTVHPDYARRSLRRRASHDRENGRFRTRARLPAARQAPRDLPGRPAARPAGKAQDHPAPSCHEKVRFNNG